MKSFLEICQLVATCFYKLEGRGTLRSLENTFKDRCILFQTIQQSVYKKMNFLSQNKELGSRYGNKPHSAKILTTKTSRHLFNFFKLNFPEYPFMTLWELFPFEYRLPKIHTKLYDAPRRKIISVYSNILHLLTSNSFE